MMSGPTEFTIGSEVSSSDGPCGELRRVVIDPVARVLTHLVVEPKHGRAKGHLVPINLVVSTTDGVTLYGGLPASKSSLNASSLA